MFPNVAASDSAQYPNALTAEGPKQLQTLSIKNRAQPSHDGCAAVGSESELRFRKAGPGETHSSVLSADAEGLRLHCRYRSPSLEDAEAVVRRPECPDCESVIDHVMMRKRETPRRGALRTPSTLPAP